MNLALKKWIARGSPPTMMEDVDNVESAREKQNLNAPTVPPKDFKKTKHPKEKRSKDSSQEVAVKELKEGLTFVAKAIENSAPEDWRVTLNKVIMAIEGHHEDDLDVVFDHYAACEHKALTFIAKPPTRQKKIVDDFIKNLNVSGEI